MTQKTNLTDDLFLVEPSEAADSPTDPTLSFSRTPTVLLTFAANRFTRSASRQYQAQFGIGAMDWRMLVMLTREPGSSVSHASRTIGIDKAAVSRCLKRLETAGLVRPDTPGPDDRRRIWTLTPEGVRMHEDILRVALDRQKDLLDGFSRQDVQTFTEYLDRFLRNLDRLNQKDAGHS